jgi:phage N-6-adenine-methyltransferase
MTFHLRNPSSVTVATSDTWATPQWVVDWAAWVLRWEAFDFDPCCVPATAKAAAFISPELGDGLCDAWKGTKVWVNPPYSNQGAWLRRCASEARNGREVVALVMPSFDAGYWRSAVWERANEVWLVEGRIAFEVDGEPRPGGNVRSCFVVYRSKGRPPKNGPKVRYLKPRPVNWDSERPAPPVCTKDRSPV